MSTRLRKCVRTRPQRPWELLLVVLLAAGCGSAEPPDAAADSASYADEMAEQHADDRPESSGATLAEPAGEVVAEEVVYGRVDDREVTGYLARPEGGSGEPGVVVIHEWWGLNDNIRSMTRRLAGRGYAALAVDLYGGRVAEEPSGAQELMASVMEDREGVRENLRAAHAYLDREVGAERVAAIGWCFGGMWSLRTALLLPSDLDAAVVYYGPPVTDPIRLGTLELPILGHFGAEDGSIPADTVRRFASVLDSLQIPNAIHLYEGAGHAFANPSGTGYRPEAAETAWTRTLDFLAEHLKQNGASP